MKWLIRIIGAAMIVVAAAAAYVATLDVNQYKDDLIDLVEENTGREFSIHGDIYLKLSLVPTLAVNGVTFGNAKWAAHKNMVTVERIEAQLALIPLLRAELALKRLAIVGGRISLETDRKGQGNWVLDLDADDTEPVAASLPRFDLNEVEILRTVVEYRGFGSDIREINIEKLQLQPNGFGQPLSVDIAAAFQEFRINLVGNVSAVRRLLANEPFVIDLTGSAGDIDFSFRGDLQEPLVGTGMKLVISVHAPRLASLGAPFALALSDRGPIEFKAVLTDIKKGYALSDVAIQATSSKISGAVSFEPLDERWRINGDIAAPEFDIGDFIKKDSGKAASKRLFSDDPLSLDWLNAIQGRLNISIAHIVDDDLSVTGLSGKITIDDGAVEIEPITAKIGDGVLSAAVEVDASGAQLKTKLDLRISKMSLGSLPKFARGNTVSGGSTDFILSLQGAGNSTAAIMASANGIYSINIGPATINNDAAAIATTGLVSILSQLNPLSSVDHNTMLECASIRFPIHNGIANNETGIGVLTQKLGILGGGTVDLRTEKLDIGAKPKPREGLGINLSSLVDFVRLGGTLTNPRVVTDAKGATTVGLKVGAAFVTAGLSILAEGVFDRLTADADVCAIARGERSIDSGKHQKDGDRSVLESPTNKTKDALKGAGAKVKGVFKGLFGD